MLSNATAFGDTAVVTIARSGGEGFDLPRDVNQEMADNPYFSYTNNSEEYTDFEDGQGYLELTRPEKVFGDLKDEFFRGQDWQTFESFKADLDAYITHWNTGLWRSNARSIPTAKPPAPPILLSRRMQSTGSS